MRKAQLVNQFTKSLIKEKQRKNTVGTQQITSTLITAAVTLAFVNESCASSSVVSKSQVIYRKLKGKTGKAKHLRTSFLIILRILCVVGCGTDAQRKIMSPIQIYKRVKHGPRVCRLSPTL